MTRLMVQPDGTLGTSAGAFFGLVFILFVFSMFMPKYKKMMKRERKIGHKEPESYRNIFRILIGTIVPGTFKYNYLQFGFYRGSVAV